MRYIAILAFVCFPFLLYADTNCTKHALFITALSNATDIIVHSNTSKEDQIDSIKVILDKNIDVNNTSRFVLGRYWKTISAEQKKLFIRTYHQYVVNSYSALITKYFQKLEIKRNSTIKDNQCIVEGKIKYRNTSIKISYFTTLINNQVHIYDIALEGKRTSIKHRNQFKNTLQHQGIQSLIDELHSTH